MNKLHTFGAVCAFFEPDIVDLELGCGIYIYYNITGRASNGIKDVDNSGVEDRYMEDRSYEDSDFEFTVDDLMDFVVTDIVYERFESVNKIRVDITIPVKDPNELERIIKEKHEKEKKLSREIKMLRGCFCGNSSETNCCGGCCSDDVCKEDVISLDKLVKPLEFTAELSDDFYENLKKVSDPVQNRNFSVKLKKNVEGTGDTKCDNVNHPKHYASASNGIECIDAIEAATERLLGLEAVCTGNVLKYIWRWKDKNGVEDLKKAKWYLEKLIEEVEKG